MRQGVTARLIPLLAILGVIAAGCGWKPGAPPPPPPDTCMESDGPTPDTVQHAIAGVPVIESGSSWIEASRGHTRDCRMYWVQLAPSSATPSSPEQLLFFDRNTALGAPTTPKPYTTVLTSGQDTVTVQYQWRVGDEPDCCPTGIGTVRYQIGADGKLTALDPIPE